MKDLNYSVLNPDKTVNTAPLLPFKLGRPTKYDRNFCQLAFEFLALGFSKEALAGKIGIAKDTLYAWIDKHEDFSYAVKKGEAASQLYWEEMGKRGANGEIKDFNSVAWLFNMKNRFHWKDRSDVTTDDQPIEGFIVNRMKSDET